MKISGLLGKLAAMYVVPDESPAEEHAGGDGDHVPVGAAAVLHDVEGRGHVAVAVVAAEVVHPSAVDVGRLRDSGVPTRRAPCVNYFQRLR